MLVSDLVVSELPDWVRQSEVLYNSCVAGAISEQEYLDGLRGAGLVDVEVRERIVYDTAQLEALAESEFLKNPRAGDCCTAPDTGTLGEVARSLTGKVWSAKVYARKPTA